MAAAMMATPAWVTNAVARAFLAARDAAGGMTAFTDSLDGWADEPDSITVHGAEVLVPEDIFSATMDDDLWAYMNEVLTAAGQELAKHVMEAGTVFIAQIPDPGPDSPLVDWWSRATGRELGVSLRCTRQFVLAEAGPSWRLRFEILGARP